MGRILFLTLFVLYLAFGQASELDSMISRIYENKSKKQIERNVLPKNCAEASNGKSGIYTINIPYTRFGPFPVACESGFDGGNWLVIQRRMDGSEDFYRPWDEYKKGFGSLEGEFIIGLDKLYYLSEYKPHELLIVMQDFENNTKFARYDEFAIGNEAELYNLKRLGAYSGTAGDSLDFQKYQNFSTYDNDNDGWAEGNCASRNVGAWWYRNCKNSNLNALYLHGKYDAPYSYGAHWKSFDGYNGYNSLKFIQMMIRPLSYYYN